MQSFALLPLSCPRCGQEIRIVTLTYKDVLMLREAERGMPGVVDTEAPSVQLILDHIGEPPTYLTLPRGAAVDDVVRPQPEYPVDPSVSR